MSAQQELQTTERLHTNAGMLLLRPLVYSVLIGGPS